MPVETSPSALRRLLRAFRKKSDTLALTILAADVALYLAATFCALRYAGTLAGVAGGALAGVATAMLFVVGHDACHGSFTTRPKWNALIGRLAFLPSLTPYSTWDLGHNRTHHVYTNLKPADYVWAPLSKAEYDALPRIGRLLERAYRTPPGVGLYYAVEIWWKRLFFPSARFVPPARVHRLDSLLCAAFGACLLAAAWRAGSGALWCAAILPFAVWNWMMGATIFGHHTHPDVPWFDDEQEWRRAESQTRCTVHLEFPRPVRVLLHQIFEHTAHHLDVTIPLYRLPDAQAEVVRHCPAVRAERWSWGMFRRHLRTCKLYDFRRHQWLDYQGTPTGRGHQRPKTQKRGTSWIASRTTLNG